MKYVKSLEWLMLIPILIVVTLIVLALKAEEVKNGPLEFSFTLYATQKDEVTKLTVTPLFDIKGWPPIDVRIFPVVNYMPENTVPTNAIKVGPEGIEPIIIHIPYQVSDVKVFADGHEVRCYENSNIHIIPAYNIIPRKFTCVNYLKPSN